MDNVKIFKIVKSQRFPIFLETKKTKPDVCKHQQGGKMIKFTERFSA